jgi:hypothetical protein
MFLNLVGNIVIIFAFQEENFVSAIKANVSRVGDREPHGRTGLILFGGGRAQY